MNNEPIKQPRSMVIDCPCCGAEIDVRNSEAMGLTLRRLYFSCEVCGYQTPAIFEVLFSLSPAKHPNRTAQLDVRDAPSLRGPVNSRTTKKPRGHK